MWIPLHMAHTYVFCCTLRLDYVLKTKVHIGNENLPL